jgi:hypothetical protein
MFSSCWSVYGLRKVLIDKEILILSDNSDDKPKNLISRIHLMYKVVTPDIKRKQNNFFWNIGLVLVTLINWLLKPKYMLIHIFEIFFVIWKYNMNFIYIFLRDLVVCMKTKNIFFLFWRKPGILIPDLYLYSIKIHTNIDQNTVKYFGKITYLIFFTGSSPPQYWSKYNKIFWKNQIFDFFCWAQPAPWGGAGPRRPGWVTGPNQWPG